MLKVIKAHPMPACCAVLLVFVALVALSGSNQGELGEAARQAKEYERLTGQHAGAGWYDFMLPEDRDQTIRDLRAEIAAGTRKEGSRSVEMGARWLKGGMNTIPVSKVNGVKLTLNCAPNGPYSPLTQGKIRISMPGSVPIVLSPDKGLVADINLPSVQTGNLSIVVPESSRVMVTRLTIFTPN